MKKLFAIVFALISITVCAQNETLFKIPIKNGVYGATVAKVGPINNEPGVFLGFQGGWIINNRLVLGGKFNMLSNPIEPAGLYNINVGFIGGGAFFEYIFASSKLLHFTAEATVGSCMVYNDVARYAEEHDPIAYTGDSGFMLEPGANIVLNITNNFRLGVGATYRLVTNINYDAGAPYQDAENSNYDFISGSDLSGFTGQIVLKYGLF
ncbi:MAG: hypothetical protein C0599_11045 [Salinivirgaceae bacterium]|nr:MAG: hypothetical protein C0599_11045 [Salinivirgaceae bacterium]